MTQPKVPKFAMPGISKLQLPTNSWIDVSLNPESFEQLIKSQGIRMIHSRPVPCPNVKDLHDASHSPACNRCYNGFIYYNPVEFIGAISNNTFDRKFNINGEWDLDQAQILVPVRDRAENIIDVQYFDQILIPDAAPVRYYQRIEHSQSGIDRCQFPVIKVDFIIGQGGQRFYPGKDVIIKDGRLHWIGNRPGYDPTLNRGEVYSVNYYTHPVFTVIGLPHQIRAAQTQSLDGLGNPNIQARFPQLSIVRKDFIPFDANDFIGEPDRPEPSNGSFR